MLLKSVSTQMSLPEWLGKHGLLIFTAILTGALAAVLAHFLGLKTLVKVMVVAVFIILLCYDLEWSYLFFILLMFILPSRFNQQVFSLGWFYLNTYEILFILLFLVWLFNALKNKRLFLFSGNFLWLLAISGSMLVSIFFSFRDYTAAVKMTAGLVEGIRFGMFFVMTCHILMDSKNISKYFYTLAGASFIVAGYGIYNYFFVESGFSFAGGPVKMFSYEKRLTVGSLIGGGATSLAALLILTMPMVFTYWLTVKNIFHKSIFLGIWITQSVMLVLTFSRGAWLSICIALFSSLIIMLKKPMKLLAGICFFMLLLALAWKFMPTEVHKRLGNFYSPRQAQNIERIFIWKQALDYFQLSPVVGTGPNNKYNTAMALSVAENYPPYHPHNWGLCSLVETGLLGAFLLFGYLGGLLLKCFFRLRNMVPGEAPPYIYGVWAGIAGFLLHSLVDYFLWQPRMSFIFWLMVLLLAYAPFRLPGRQYEYTASG